MPKSPYSTGSERYPSRPGTPTDSREEAEIYAGRPWATGGGATFADCMTHEAIAWCVRQNDACKALYEASPSLVSFMNRFRALPPIGEFMKRQEAARAKDDSL